MAVGSIVVAALSLACVALAVITTPIPGVGAAFAFGAPVLALAGVIMGGVAMSRGKRAGQPTDLALAGVIFSALCLVPALLTALTCGVCNALCATGKFETRRDFRFGVQRGTLAADAGQPDVPAPPPPPPIEPLEPPPAKPAPGQPSRAPEPAPAQRPAAPPPTFPPPPLPPPPAPPPPAPP